MSLKAKSTRLVPLHAPQQLRVAPRQSGGRRTGRPPVKVTSYMSPSVNTLSRSTSNVQHRHPRISNNNVLLYYALHNNENRVALNVMKKIIWNANPEFWTGRRRTPTKYQVSLVKAALAKAATARDILKLLFPDSPNAILISRENPYLNMLSAEYFKRTFGTRKRMTTR
jgi:hypothetical protein